MIQEIGTKRLCNEYKDVKPKAGDIVFCFQQEKLILAKKDGGNEFPTVQKLQAVCQERRCEMPELIYLFAIGEQSYYLAMDLEADLMPEKHENLSAKRKQENTYGKELQTKIEQVQIEQNQAEQPQIEQNQTEPEQSYEAVNIRALREGHSRKDAFAGATAWHLYHWYDSNRFCGKCGHAMQQDDKERMMKCPVCGNMAYPRINPAVIIGVRNGDKLMMTKYSGRAYKRYALVAGFVEFGETLEETVAREVYEEVGVRVKNVTYYKSQPWGFDSDLLAGFYCDLDGDDTIRMDDEELAVAEWMHYSEIPDDADGLSLTAEMMQHFKQKKMAEHAETEQKQSKTESRLQESQSEVASKLQKSQSEAESKKGTRLTTLCYIEQDESYLMLYRNKKENDQSEGKWLGIGGKFEPGETPDECMLREVQEETGLILTDYQFRGVVSFISDIYENEYMFLYTATGFTGEIKENCDEGMLKWILKSEIMDLSLWEGDRIFLRDLMDGKSHIDLKLEYEGDILIRSSVEPLIQDRE